MLPAFKLELNNPILKGLVSVGKFDGEHPSLTCATSAGKIFFHTPHEKDAKDQVRFLNINRKISALACGTLDASIGRDVLLVGAQTTLLAYDVNDNRDLFFKDTPDGANQIVVGRLGGQAVPMAFVGGNCSIQGFDKEGNETFWTVTGDNVSSMAFCDVDGDGGLELMVGSDDFEIRCFRGEEVISESTETDRPVQLARLQHTSFAYALSNGTIGVYETPSQRRWRVKSKHQVTAITGFDLDGDGHPELVSGWANGKLEVRSDRSGEVIFKDNLGAPISAIVQADYRSDGRTEVIVCSSDGEVRGYLPIGAEMDGGAGGQLEGQVQEDTLRELQQRKQEMLYELKQYADASHKDASGERGAPALPPGTAVAARLEPAPGAGCLHLVLSTSHGTLLRAALVFGERVFQGAEGPDGPSNESLAVHTKAPAAQLNVPLRPPRDVAAQLQIKAIVADRPTSLVCHVLELDFALPKFCMYVPVEPSPAGPPTACATFGVRAPVAHVREWVGATFGVSAPRDAAGGFDAAMISLRDATPLWIRMREGGSASGGGTVGIHTPSMDLAGEIVQEMAAALGWSEVRSVANFPEEMEQFRRTLETVDECNAIRLHMTAEIADSSNLAKTLVVKAEDARILGEMRAMREAYKQLNALNGELIGEYTKRAKNHEQLLAALKQVNQMIQRAAKLRVGPTKALVVTACREAIKANNIQALLKIIRDGSLTS